MQTPFDLCQRSRSSSLQLSEADTANTTPDDETKIISISSTFFPGSHSTISDTILRSSDGVLFYVNSDTLLKCSPDALRAVLGTSLTAKRFREGIIDVPDTSIVLNIILHVFYCLSPARYSPSLDDIEKAVNRFADYGLKPPDHILPATPIFQLLLLHAPVSALRIYVLAAQHKLYPLAEKVSSHLLGIPLSSVDDDMVTRMGPIFFKRLACLHMNLIDSLKNIILQPPYPHPPTDECDFAEQKKLSRAWALAASYIAWDSKPGRLSIYFPPTIGMFIDIDVSISAIQNTFSALGEHLACQDCHAVLRKRIHEIVVQWANVKVYFRCLVFRRRLTS